LDHAFDRYIGTDRDRVESFEEELVNTEDRGGISTE
jgi:hypothetical protein